MAKTKLLIVHHRHRQYSEYIREHKPSLEIDSFDYRDEIPFSTHDAEILLSWKFRTGLLERLPKLRWIAAAAAGVDKILAERPQDRGIVVTRAEATMSEFMAQYVLSNMLNHLRDVPKLESQRRERVWRHVHPELLQRKTLGIIGLGNIGSRIAERAKSFGMTVYGARREPSDSPHVDRVFAGESWREMLTLCDFLVITVPLTAQTERMIGAPELKSMRLDAVLINIARGQIIDEAALIETLMAGTIAGAVLDVFETEPLPPEHPFWEMDNVVVTPHCAGPSEDGPICDEFLENYRRWLAGEPLLRVADPQRGY